MPPICCDECVMKKEEIVAENKIYVSQFIIYCSASKAIRHCCDMTVKIMKTRTVRGSDYSPTIELSKQKDKLVTATGDTEKYSEKRNF